MKDDLGTVCGIMRKLHSNTKPESASITKAKEAVEKLTILGGGVCPDLSAPTMANMPLVLAPTGGAAAPSPGGGAATAPAAPPSALDPFSPPTNLVTKSVNRKGRVAFTTRQIRPNQSGGRQKRKQTRRRNKK